LSATDTLSSDGSAMNLHASGTDTPVLSGTGSSGWPWTLSSGATHSACAMTNSSTPLDARKAFLSATETVSSDGSAMNLHASGTDIITPSDTGSSGWPWTLSSGATHSACAMTNASTPLDARKAFLSATDTLSSDGSAMNLQAVGTSMMTSSFLRPAIRLSKPSLRIVGAFLPDVPAAGASSPDRRTPASYQLETLEVAGAGAGAAGAGAAGAGITASSHMPSRVE